jgi:hypothetical protein
LQWLKDPSKTNADNLNIRRQTSKHFRNKKREYLKGKIYEIATNNKNRSIRDLYTGINEFKGGYQPRRNLVKDENSDLADSHNILNRWKNYFSQLLNAHRVSIVRQTEIHTIFKECILLCLFILSFIIHHNTMIIKISFMIPV